MYFVYGNGLAGFIGETFGINASGEVTGGPAGGTSSTYWPRFFEHLGTTIQRLNPLEVPLHGSRLIEASTGKTITLAMFHDRAACKRSRPCLP